MRKLSQFSSFFVLLAGGIFFLNQLSSIKELRSGLLEQENRLESLRREAASLRDDLATLGGEIEDQARALTSARTSQSLLEHKEARLDPKTRWASPPELLPDWEPESPYIWLNKETLALLPWESFTREGHLTREVTTILTLNPEQIAEVNWIAGKVLQDCRVIESQLVRASTNHLGQAREAKGPKHTIEIPAFAEEGARLKAEFQARLVRALGEAKGGFVAAEAAAWIRTELGGFGAQPRSISVVSYGSEEYLLIMGSHGITRFSTGRSLGDILRYIPSHLMVHFEHLQHPSATQVSAAE